MVPAHMIEENIGDLSVLQSDRLNYKRITQPDKWLEIAYQLLADHFDSNLLHSYDQYVEWINAGEKYPFPLLMLVSYYSRGDQAMIAGVVSGNIMEVREGPARSEDKNRSFICAIGHQARSPVLVSKGIRGCDADLFDAVIKEARESISHLGGKFCYSVLEAERGTIDFYSKLGYRWPRAVSYFRPPIHFLEDGTPAAPEFPEIIMIRAENPNLPSTAIEKTFLEKIIRTIYLNRSLHKPEQVLQADAFSRASEYVMGKVFGKVRGSMPESQSVDLVEMRVNHGVERKHFRTFALGQGLEHRFELLESLDLGKIRDFDEMLQAMSHMAFGARTLGEAFEVLYAMCSDPGCKVVLTLSGALSIAKLDLIISEMIERGLIHCIVSTGAILSHGFNAERGAPHFKVPSGVSDEWLFEHGYDRIFDTIELESSLDETEQMLAAILSSYPIEQPLCSSELIRLIGEWLVRKNPSQGIIQSAYKNNVPIFVPAFSDSELGVDFAIFNHYRRRANLPEITFDPYLDFNGYCELVKNAATRGILTLGGGVPRNWGQQVCTYIDAIERRQKGISSLDVRFKYGIRICPDPAYWGGLSGATYSEGITWGKFMAPDEGGRFAEVYSDFSFVLPFLIKGLFQRLDKQSH